jgi:hypothetical protein
MKLVERVKNQMKTFSFKQFVSSKKIYSVHVGPDGEHHLAAKPIWTLEHFRLGDPWPHSLADIETSTDCMSARLIAHGLTGLVKVTVALIPHEGTTWTESFAVELIDAPRLAEQSIKFQQHRNSHTL